MAELGSVAALFRYPVKSMLGERLDAATFTERGVEGDRAWAVLDRSEPLPFALYQAFEPFLVRAPVTYHDSRLSFRRAYTPREMQSIAARELPGVTVRLNVPSLRWVLEWVRD